VRPDRCIKELVENMKSGIRNAVEGRTYTDEEAMKERIRHIRE